MNCVPASLTLWVVDAELLAFAPLTTVYRSSLESCASIRSLENCYRLYSRGLRMLVKRALQPNLYG